MESISKQQCPVHTSPYIYICAVNQWHFQPLCNLCVPQHSKSHQKSKVQMCIIQLKQAHQKGMLIKKSYQQQSQTALLMLREIQQKNLEQCCQQIINLKNKRIQLQNLINSVFQQMIKQYIEKKQLIKSSILGKQYERIKKILDDQLNKFRNEKESNTQSIQNIKLYYFKPNINPIIEQSQQICLQYEKYVIKKKIMNIDIKSIQNFLKKKEYVIFQEQHISKQQQNDKINLLAKKEIQKQGKAPGKGVQIKKEKIKIQKKRCKECNNELEYLTDMKKHLVCKVCGNNQRNYVKKN